MNGLEARNILLSMHPDRKDLLVQAVNDRQAWANVTGRKPVNPQLLAFVKGLLGMGPGQRMPVPLRKKFQRRAGKLVITRPGK